jgi:hypothetical protein
MAELLVLRRAASRSNPWRPLLSLARIARNLPWFPFSLLAPG